MFNIEKLIQACNYLIKKSNQKINYTKLIKLLYLADRESLELTTQSITGDKYVCMRSGPVLSRLYDLIKGKYSEADQVLWNSRFIKDGYDLVVTTENIPQGELSLFETQVLDKIYEKFKDYTVPNMIEYVHNNCHEWKNPSGSSAPLNPKRILRNIGKTNEEIDWIIAETEAFEEEDRAFLSLADA